jgi:hypothetical protein
MTYLDEIESRCEKATPGKYEIIEKLHFETYLKQHGRNVGAPNNAEYQFWREREHYKTQTLDIPILVARLRRAIAEFRDIADECYITLRPEAATMLHDLADELERAPTEGK